MAVPKSALVEGVDYVFDGVYHGVYLGKSKERVVSYLFLVCFFRSLVCFFRSLGIIVVCYAIVVCKTLMTPAAWRHFCKGIRQAQDKCTQELKFCSNPPSWCVATDIALIVAREIEALEEIDYSTSVMITVNNVLLGVPADIADRRDTLLASFLLLRGPPPRPATPPPAAPPAPPRPATLPPGAESPSSS